jgi:hypothetical protein
MVLDAVVEARAGRVRVRLERVVDRFTPAQERLEFRLPPQFGSVVADGVRSPMQPHSLEPEDRSARVARVVLPLATREASFE